MPCETRYLVERNIAFFYSLDQTKVSARLLFRISPCPFDLG
jgi:hypothetical protein